jgi:predicted amidohydrolase YtcJ
MRSPAYHHPTASQPARAAQRLLRDGKIYTLNPFQPWAEALGISGNLLSFIGSDREADKFVDLSTEVIDLGGRFVMPGFNDAHIHFVPGMLPALREFGVTTAQTISNVGDLPSYLESAKEGNLTTRLEVRLPLGIWSQFPRFRGAADESDGLVRVIGLKAYADGLFRDRTAYLVEPYAGAATERGCLSSMATDSEYFDQQLDGAVSVGADVSTHAIGDAGVRFVLDRYQRLMAKHTLEDHRFRIIHATLVSPGDFAKFGELRLIAEVNPFHTQAIPWLTPIIGEARARWAFAFRSLKANGAQLCFGSDHPGPSGKNEFPLNPLLGVQAAIMNPHRDERLTLSEALAAYTVASAHAARAENHKGTLEVGKLADLIVLSENPFEVPPTKIAAIKVLETWMNGKVVFSTI